MAWRRKKEIYLCMYILHVCNIFETMHQHDCVVTNRQKNKDGHCIVSLSKWFIWNTWNIAKDSVNNNTEGLSHHLPLTLSETFCYTTDKNL